jgi:type IV secretion system protein VirB1
VIAFARARGAAEAHPDEIARVPALVAACAPAVHPQTLTAIIDVESSGWPWTIHDNDDGASYYDDTYAEAVDRATALLHRGHNVDLGIAQINSGNLAGLRTDVANVFLPCTNVAYAQTILRDCYKRAVTAIGEANPYVTVRFAVACYNTNSLYAGWSYVRHVLAAATALGSLPNYAVRFAPPHF